MIFLFRTNGTIDRRTMKLSVYIKNLLRKFFFHLFNPILILLNKQLIKRSCVKIFHIIYINTYLWNVECNNFYKKIIIFILIAMLFLYYAVSFPLLCKKSFIIKNFCRFIDNIIQACVTASLDTKLQHYISYYFLFCRSAL